MCLVALAIGRSERFPVVIAANRDEFHARPAAPLGWWPTEPPILAGRDLEAGGTWMGLTASGRFGFVTNVRGMKGVTPAAPSRGEIVPQWLTGSEGFDTFWPRTLAAGHNGFNLVVADFAHGECFWASNCGDAPVRLGDGIHAVSNHLLDTPWPKLVALKARLQAAVESTDGIEALAEELFAALADRGRVPDDRLPSTGIPPDRERGLSSAFVDMPEIGYGTRCSTLLVCERLGAGRITHVLERSFAPHDGATMLRRFALDGWPPRAG